MNMEIPRTHADSSTSPRTHELMSNRSSTVDYFAFSVARASLKSSFNATFSGGKPHVYHVTDLCFVPWAVGVL